MSVNLMFRVLKPLTEAERRKHDTDRRRYSHSRKCATCSNFHEKTLTCTIGHVRTLEWFMACERYWKDKEAFKTKYVDKNGFLRYKTKQNSEGKR